MRMLFVSKSLCGYVSNQVQYKTHTLTTTHKRNPKGFLSVYWRIFDFQFYSVFLTVKCMLL